MLAVVGIGLAMLIVGVAFWKLIGLEAMHFLQMLFFCMTLVDILPPMLGPVTELNSFVNGYNGMFRDYPELLEFDDPTMQKMEIQMQIGARFLQNINYMLITQVIAISFAIFFTCLKCILKARA